MIPWIQVVENLYIGQTGRPYATEFDHVLTVSVAAPLTDPRLRHRHLPPPENDDKMPKLIDIAVTWLRPRWFAGRKILIQGSEYPWAETLAAAVLIDMGATSDEAIESLRKAKPDALASSVYRAQLKEREVPR